MVFAFHFLTFMLLAEISKHSDRAKKKPKLPTAKWNVLNAWSSGRDKSMSKQEDKREETDICEVLAGN